jgi:tRNA threonylcarbamoyladenosine biosynthesis protein TsaE
MLIPLGSWAAINGNGFIITTMKEIIIVKNIASLEKFAAHFAKRLKGGEIVGLVGELGAGKTTFVQSMSRVFSVKAPVRSPTYILLQELKVPKAVAKKTGINAIVHIDAYRLKNEQELFAIGFEDFAERHDVVIMIEWADRLPSVQWLDHYREIMFDFGVDGERVLTVENGIGPD